MLGRKHSLLLHLFRLWINLEVKNIMNSITEETLFKHPHISMEEYDDQVFRTQTKS